MRVWQRRVGGNRAGASRRVLLITAVVFVAAVTVVLPVAIVMLLLVAIDAGVLVYWFRVRSGRDQQAGKRLALAPMRRLAEVVSMTGVLLLFNALWLTVLGGLTQFGITSDATARWSSLAASGVQVRPEQPALFGARGLVVAAAVWLVGFGLTKASGEKA